MVVLGFKTFYSKTMSSSLNRSVERTCSAKIIRARYRPMCNCEHTKRVERSNLHVCTHGTSIYAENIPGMEFCTRICTEYIYMCYVYFQTYTSASLCNTPCFPPYVHVINTHERTYVFTSCLHITPYYLLFPQQQMLMKEYEWMRQSSNHGAKST